MFSRKSRQRHRRIIAGAVIALIAHLMIPTQGHAQTVNPSVAGQIIRTEETLNIKIHQLAPAEVNFLPPPADRPVLKTITVRSSAYSSTVDQCDRNPFTTASGTTVHHGTLATNGLPFGTKVRIPDYFGQQVFTVEDRMSGKWGKSRIDIWMPTKTEAIQWGVRTVKIEILS